MDHDEQPGRGRRRPRRDRVPPEQRARHAEALEEMVALATVDEDGLPIAWCIYEPDGDGCHRVVRCPHCQRRHLHGRYLGHVVEHCVTNPYRSRGGYVLCLLPSEERRVKRAGGSGPRPGLQPPSPGDAGRWARRRHDA